MGYISHGLYSQWKVPMISDISEWSDASDHPISEWSDASDHPISEWPDASDQSEQWDQLAIQK